MKQVIILRGAMGAGKSTFAQLLTRLGGVGMVETVSADYYWVRIGKPFDPSLLQEAHASCMAAFIAALQHEVPVIIVDNTNQTGRDFEKYRDLAASVGYKVTFLVVENRHGGSSTKPVPREIVERAKTRIRSTIQL